MLVENKKSLLIRSNHYHIFQKKFQKKNRIKAIN